jgi:hypothetical protein
MQGAVTAVQRQDATPESADAGKDKSLCVERKHVVTLFVLLKRCVSVRMNVVRAVRARQS